eukprot:scaffold2119_cov355-Prasinococcus_capsulatus_cf.AAC.12
MPCMGMWCAQERVTQAAYNSVAVYGFNKEVGMVSYPPNNQELTKPFSEDTARLIDLQVRSLVDQAYTRTVELVREKKALVEALAQELLKKEVRRKILCLLARREVLTQEDIIRVLGPRPFQNAEQTNYDRYMKGFGGSLVEEGGGVSGGDDAEQPAEDDDDEEGEETVPVETVKVLPGFGTAS